MNFSIKDLFSKCDQIRSFPPADLVTFTEEILNGKLHFFCAVRIVMFKSLALVEAFIYTMPRKTSF